MLECKGGGIYTGIAIDVDERYKKHLSGKGARYTKMHPPLRVLAKKEYNDRRSAAQAEYAIKQMQPFEKWRWAVALNGLKLTYDDSSNC